MDNLKDYFEDADLFENEKFIDELSEVKLLKEYGY